MPKRKAASRKQDGARGAKKPRAAAAAAAAKPPEATDADASFGTALARANLAPRIATQTLKLVHAINAADGNFTLRTQSVVDLLTEDAHRSESLLDLSLVVEGEQSCGLFQLFCFFHKLNKYAADSGDVKADKRAAHALIRNKVLPLKQNLLRSFDPATVGVATGNNALHEMYTRFSLESVNGWPYRLCQLLIDRGVSLHARNKDGRTPLLQRAARCTSANKQSNEGSRLLLQHGADLNAQDGEGNGVLHHLVQRQIKGRLEDLLGGDGVAHFDYALRNNAGQTAVDLAAIQLAQLADSSADSPQKRIHQLLMTQKAMWTKLVQPLLFRCLDVVLPVTDLAKLTMGYTDGSGLPFAPEEAEAETDDDDELAAAAAAAAQS